MIKKKSIADLKIGEKGVVSNLKDKEMSLKLLEMGVLPGCEICLRSKAPLGDPVCVCVSGYNLSLRLDEASTIEVN